ncbi:MAG: DUF1189 family protein [Desulfomonile tiedjei]|nr:DUF1189 family protein [Desulfomonile tiedjei]
MTRGIARWICAQSAVVAIAAVLFCAAISAFGLVWANAPRLESFLNWAVEKYDVTLPQITFKNGHASIREKQPYIIDTGGEKDVAIVIDTRDGKENEAPNYLKEADSGVVLTGESLVTKDRGQIRIISLKDMPDFVFNSRNLQDLLDQFLPTVIWYGTIVVILYFLLMKPLQVLILGLIPYFGAQTYSVALTFGQAMKIAAIAMIPPVLLDTLVQFADTRLPFAFVLYFGLYIVLLCLAVRDLVRSPERQTDPTAGLTPS